jgi:hypothetical protein
LGRRVVAGIQDVVARAAYEDVVGAAPNLTVEENVVPGTAD